MTLCKPCISPQCHFTPWSPVLGDCCRLLGFLVSGCCSPLPGFFLHPLDLSPPLLWALLMPLVFWVRNCPIATCPTGGIDTGGHSALSLSLPPSLLQADLDLTGTCALVAVPRLPIARLKHPSFPFVSLLNAAHYWRLCLCPTFSIHLIALDSHQSCLSLGPSCI